MKYIKEKIKEFINIFDNPRKSTYIGDLLQYEDKEGNVIYVIDDVIHFIESALKDQRKKILDCLPIVCAEEYSEAYMIVTEFLNKLKEKGL
jgi:hypothetical protein